MLTTLHTVRPQRREVRDGFALWSRHVMAVAPELDDPVSAASVGRGML
jgi:hypothetical protein